MFQRLVLRKTNNMVISSNVLSRRGQQFRLLSDKSKETDLTLQRMLDTLPARSQAVVHAELVESIKESVEFVKEQEKNNIQWEVAEKFLKDSKFQVSEADGFVSLVAKYPQAKVTVRFSAQREVDEMEDEEAESEQSGSEADANWVREQQEQRQDNESEQSEEVEEEDNDDAYNENESDDVEIKRHRFVVEISFSDKGKNKGSWVLECVAHHQDGMQIHAMATIADTKKEMSEEEAAGLFVPIDSFDFNFYSAAMEYLDQFHVNADLGHFIRTFVLHSESSKQVEFLRSLAAMIPSPENL